MSKNEDFIVDKFIQINFGNPINCLNLNENILAMGFMDGKIIIYDIKNNKVNLIKDQNIEYIFDISYSDNQKAFFIGINNDEVKKYNTDNLTNNNLETIFLNNNIPNELLKAKYENYFSLLSPKSLFRLELDEINDDSTIIYKTDKKYELQYFDSKIGNNTCHMGKLTITNYTVPLDFNGDEFLWVEFLSSGRRNICMVNIPSLTLNKTPYKYELKNDEIGHISFGKLLTNNIIFIVHSQNKCELRNLDKNFSILEDFIHNGEEVYGFDIIYDENIDRNNKILSEIQIKGTTYSNKNRRDIVILNGIKGKGLETTENLFIKSNLKKYKDFNILNFFIITLDIKGNVNLYNNKKELTLFNMYDLQSIQKDIKEKQFFSMGYSYYIKTNLNYFCITTDYGCFIIKNSKK